MTIDRSRVPILDVTSASRLADEILHVCVGHGNDEAFLREWLKERLIQWLESERVRNE